MNIYEYQTKDIFSKYGIPIPIGAVVMSKKDIDRAINSIDSNNLVIKAQILAGGRCKGGGIKFATNKQEAKDIANEMLGKKLVTSQTSFMGQKIENLYIEERIAIDKEYYLCLLIDSSSGCLEFIVSAEGGIEVERNAQKFPKKINRMRLKFEDVWPFHVRRLGFNLGLKDDLLKQFCDIVMKIYKIFIDTDATQIEVNPLVVTKEKKIVVLDAKSTFDSNALFRQIGLYNLKNNSHEEKSREENLNYISMEGDIGCIVNGAGLAMATSDVIRHYGGRPANFLDVGGGVNKVKIQDSLKIIASNNNVKLILVNIFGGIVRCDTIAEDIIESMKSMRIEASLVVRLAGTNADLGEKKFRESGLNILFAHNIEDAVKQSINLIKRK